MLYLWADLTRSGVTDDDWEPRASLVRFIIPISAVVRADTQESTPAAKLIERVDWDSVSYQVRSICEARTPGQRCWRTAGHAGDHDWVVTQEKPTP